MKKASDIYRKKGGPELALRKLGCFAGKRNFDPRVHEQMGRLLDDPQNKEMYEAVFRKVAFVLTRGEPTETLRRVAYLMRGSQPFAQNIPWAAAMDVFCDVSNPNLTHKRIDRDGIERTYYFRGEGRQARAYRDLSGADCTIDLPQQMRLMFYRKGGVIKPVANPKTGEEICLTVSEQTALQCVTRERDKVQREMLKYVMREPSDRLDHLGVA